VRGGERDGQTPSRGWMGHPISPPPKRACWMALLPSRMSPAAPSRTHCAAPQQPGGAAGAPRRSRRLRIGGSEGARRAHARANSWLPIFNPGKDQVGRRRRHFLATSTNQIAHSVVDTASRANHTRTLRCAACCRVAQRAQTFTVLSPCL
jgi:hypothetical protein